MCCKIHEGRREHFSVLKTVNLSCLGSIEPKLLPAPVSIVTETGNADRSMSSSVAET